MDRGETGKHGVNAVNRVEAGNNSGHDNVTILPHSITVPTARATVQKHNNVEHNTVQVCVANPLLHNYEYFSSHIRDMFCHINSTEAEYISIIT